MDLYPGHFIYSVVRNPCRRFLSRYRHAGRYPEMRTAYTPNHPASNGTHREFAELCAGLLAATGNFRRAPATAFFRDNGQRRYGPPGIQLRHLEFVFGHARPQTRFLPACDGERLFGLQRRRPAPADFIGAVESIDADCRRLQEALCSPRRPQDPASLKGMTARFPA